MKRVGYVTDIKPSYINVNTVNALYLAINKINGYIEENIGNNYLKLVPTEKSKEMYMKKKREKCMKNCWLKSKISDDFDQKYVKIKFNSDGNIPPKDMFELDVTGNCNNY